MFKYFLITLLFFSKQSLASLTLDIIIKEIKERDLNWQILENQKKILDYQIDANLPSRVTTLDVENEKGFNQATNQNTNILSAEINKRIIETGTALNVRHSKTTRPDRTENVIQLRVEQSLLRDAFGGNTRLYRDYLTFDTTAKKLVIEERQEAYIVEKILEIFNLIKLKNEFLLSESDLNESKKLTRTIIEKRKLKIASQGDLHRAKLQELSSKENFVTKKNAFYSAFDSFKIQYQLRDFSLDKKQMNNKMLDNFIANFKIEDIKLDQNKENELRSIKIQDLYEISSKKNLDYLNNLDAPQLNLIAGYNKDDSNRFNTTIKREETVVGVKLSIPFGDSVSDANILKAKVENLVASNNKIIMKRNWEIAIKNLQLEIAQLKNKIDILNEKISLTELILKEEQDRFNIGKRDLEVIIDLKNNLNSYKNELSSSKYSYVESILKIKSELDLIDLI